MRLGISESMNTTPFRRCKMAPDERERMRILCERIAKEQDSHVFSTLVQELNELLEGKPARLEQEPQETLRTDQLHRAVARGDCWC
jgi:hypothetical protein